MNRDNAKWSEKHYLSHIEARRIKRSIARDIGFRHWSRNMRSWFTDSLTPALTHLTEGAD